MGNSASSYLTEDELEAATRMGRDQAKAQISEFRAKQQRQQAFLDTQEAEQNRLRELAAREDAEAAIQAEAAARAKAEEKAKKWKDEAEALKKKMEADALKKKQQHERDSREKAIELEAQEIDRKKRAAEKQELANRMAIAERDISKARQPRKNDSDRIAARQAEPGDKFAGNLPRNIRTIPTRPTRSNRANSSSSESSTDLTSWNSRKEPRGKVNNKEGAQKADQKSTEAPQKGKTPTAPSASTLAGQKRPLSTASVFGDDRRLSMDRIPKRLQTSVTSTASPQSPGTPVDAPERRLPEWYSKLNRNGKRVADDANADSLIGALRTQVEKAVKMRKEGDKEKLQNAVRGVRDKLHKIAFVKVNEQLLRNHWMLHPQGLPAIFDPACSDGVEWPCDIRADAEEQYNKWCARIFENDLLRGIIPGKPGQKGSDKVDNLHKVSSKVFGNGKLLNGQWWPTLLCALRDGAHGEAVKGISGDANVGAYSCFISGGKENTYPDIDNGDIVFYCGTDDEKRSGNITPSTKLMLDNLHDEDKPVRFLRSSKAKSKSQYAPECGYRYDGLYDVVGVEVLDTALQRHRFKLVRRDGQGDIRGGDGPERRPTDEEVEAYKKDKRLRGFDV